MVAEWKQAAEVEAARRVELRTSAGHVANLTDRQIYCEVFHSLVRL